MVVGCSGSTCNLRLAAEIKVCIDQEAFINLRLMFITIGSGANAAGLAQLEDTLSPHSPSIVVHHSEGFTATEVPVQRIPHDLLRAQSSGKSLSTASESFELADSAHHIPSGGVLPSSVTYTLHLTCDGSTDSGERPDLTVHYNDVHSYQAIEKIAQDCIEGKFADALMGKSLQFTYGNCSIGQDVDKMGIPLKTREDWDKVCTILTNYRPSNVDRTLHVDIYRDYFSRSLAAREVSFADTKRSQIQALMKRASNNKRYIPRTARMRVTSPDQIREIIVQDLRLEMEPRVKEAFIQTVQEKASCLLAICVLAGLSMNCLKRLLDNNCCDASLPLGDHDLCHPECKVNFFDLVDKQGGFRTANFDIPGQHQDFDPDVVIPIHYKPVDLDKDDFASNGRRRDLENRESGAYHDTLSQKAKAFCGSVSVYSQHRSLLF